MSASYTERAASYREDAAHYRRQIDRADPDDPETGDAVRQWSRQLEHAERMADECDRWAQY